MAATIKVPGLAGALFIAVAWLRAEPSWRERIRFAAAATLIVACVLAAVSAVTGLGLSWITSTVFSTPAKVRLAITPGTGAGYTVASLLHDLGATVNYRSVEAAFGAAAGVLVVASGPSCCCARGSCASCRRSACSCCWRRPAGRRRGRGTSPGAWCWWRPSPARNARGPLAVALAVSVFVVKPGGVVALPLPSAPAVLVVYALIAGALWYAHQRGETGASSRGAGGADGSGVETGPGAQAGGIAGGARPPLART